MIHIYKLALTYCILILSLILIFNCSENVKLNADIKVTASTAKNTEENKPKDPAPVDSSSFSDTYENFSVGMKKSDIQSQISGDKSTFTSIKPETAQGSFFGLSSNTYDQQYELTLSQNENKESPQKIILLLVLKKFFQRMESLKLLIFL